MKVLLLSSSSGGHINPCIAFGNYLEIKGIEVKYLGFKNQMEEKIIPKDKLLTLDSKNSFSKVVKNPLEIVKLFKEIKKIKKEKYDIYIGFGGFITLISLFIKDKKPLFLHEQNVVIGDSNKICRFFSKKIFYSFPNDDKKGIVVGNPSGERVKQKHFSYKNKFNVLFIFGSLGSSSLIEKLCSIENQLDKNNTYTLITGSNLYTKYKDKFKHINVREYISLKDDLINYDIVFSRGGATSLYEILSSNTYCVSIPSPYVKNNHQEKNVDYLVDLGLITKLKEKEFNAEEINKKIYAFNDFDYSLAKFKKMNEFNHYKSSQLMYEEIMKYVKG